MVLPAGTQLPPFPHLVLLAIGVAGVVWGLYRTAVTIDDRTLVAGAPWMGAGASAYVVYQLEVLPSLVAPLFGSPSVYATTMVVAGAIWLGATRTTRPLTILGVTGGAVFVVTAGVALAIGAARDSLAPVVPLGGVVVGTALAVVVWLAFVRVRPEDATTVGLAGPLVVFAHALDGVSTAVGVDLLGYGERTPLSRLIMEGAGSLPTAEVLGVGWLFVAVKLTLSVVVLALLADYVREEPAEGFGLLGLVAAVGLGPGVNNVLLFVVLGPAGF